MKKRIQRKLVLSKETVARYDLVRGGDQDPGFTRTIGNTGYSVCGSCDTCPCGTADCNTGSCATNCNVCG